MIFFHPTIFENNNNKV